MPGRYIRRTGQKKIGKWQGRFNTARKWAGVAGSVAATAGTALSIASRVASLVNVEFKFVDTAINLDYLTPLDSSNPVIIDMTTTMAQGVGANQFIGQSVLMKSLFLRMRIVPKQGTGILPWTNVRVLLFIDRNLDGTAPTVTDILQTNTYLSPMSMNMPDRYQIIHDRTYNASNSSNYTRALKIFKRLHHHFKVSAAAPTSDRTGRIFLLLLTDSPNPDGPSVDLYSRLRFIDN